MRKLINLFLVVVIGFFLCGCGQGLAQEEKVFQVSTIKALLAGVYDGEVTFGQLKQQGDLGLGTLNGLDGEMVAVDGRFYQIKTDGVAYPVSDQTKTPFAVATFFTADREAVLPAVDSQDQLGEVIDKLLPTKNIFYAIRIDGIFRYIKARSVPRQEEPYPPLAEVVKKQTVFEFHDVAGTIVGIRSPDYVAGLNVTGYHFHFITKDRKAGGHVLDCRLAGVKAAIDYINDFSLVLPSGGEFYQLDLAADRKKELTSVEK